MLVIISVTEVFQDLATKKRSVQATSKDWACAVSLSTFVQLQDLGKPLYDVDAW
jgi:hypothetical protein